MTRVSIPIDALRDFSRASSEMVADVRPLAGDLADALATVRTTTDPGWRPPVFGDGSDVHRWCDDVGEVDDWVSRVADVFEEVDNPTYLSELLLLPAAGLPDVATASIGWGSVFGLVDAVGPQTIEEFDEIRDDLGDRPDLLGPWIDSLPADQREVLFRQRWAALIGMDGLTDAQRDALYEAARADVPRTREWEQVAQEYGWGFLSIGTQLKVERIVEFDGDVFLTIEIEDSVAGKLDESLTGKTVEVSLGGQTTYQLTMQFRDMDHLEEVLDDIDEVFLPGNPDIPWWAPGPRQTIEFGTQTELELAGRIEKYEDLVVGNTRSYGLTGDIDVLDGLFTAGGTSSVGLNRNTGNTVVTDQVRAGTDLRQVFPDEVVVGVGHGDLVSTNSVELSPDGEVVARTTTTNLSVEAGSVELSTPRGGIEFGTDEGVEAIHTRTEDADGNVSEMLVIADTEVDRFGLEIAPDPRFPRASLSYESGEAVTAHVYVRDANGDWIEVTE